MGATAEEKLVLAARARDAQDFPAAALGRADVVARLVERSGAARSTPRGKVVARSMPWTLDAAVDELSFRERPAGVRALRVHRVHGLTLAHDDQLLGTCLGGCRSTFRDFRQVELRPFGLADRTATHGD